MAVGATGKGPRRRFDPRAHVFGQLLLTLSGIAIFSTALTIAAQDLVLARDLEHAAGVRLASAARATGRLADLHSEAVRERYRAISGTPQFRANLEVQHTPTLHYYAQSLQQRQGAALLTFLDGSGRTRVFAGDASLAPDTVPEQGARLVTRQGRLSTEVVIPMGPAEQPVGWMIALESIDAKTIGRWSELSGARVFVESSRPEHHEDEGLLVQTVRDFGDVSMRVEADLTAERAALRNSRANVLLAGVIALGLSLVTSVFLSRGVVRPIREIGDAAERIGRGDLDAHLESSRRDEIGQVARAFDTMIGRLGAQRRELDDQMEKLETSQERLAGAQRIARLGSFEIDFATHEILASDILRELFRLAPGDGPIRLEELQARLPADEQAMIIERYEMCVAEGTPFRFDHRLELQDGDERIIHTQAEILRDDFGTPIAIEGTVQDVTERHRAEEQIRFLAYHDSLTGLGNRRLFHERVEHAVADAERRGTYVGVIFLDLDLFKRINDTHGHTVGDEVLQKVAGRLMKSIRETDLVSREGISRIGGFETAISRLGGDEFTILVTDVEDPQALAKVARRLLDGMKRPFDVKDQEIVISASIGIAAWPVDGSDVDTLLRNADSAMYHAKKQGRNNYQFYASTMNAAAMKRLSLETKLRRALTTDDFRIYLQPRVSLLTGAAVNFEALARWEDPELGMVMPCDFIPVAEESGLIVDLGRRVLRDACAIAARWSGMGCGLPISVNLSVHQFQSGSLIDDIEEILRTSAVDPGLIELEITESALVHDERAVLADLERLRALGLRIALDDFGTGYSSLSMLRRMPVDVLKIDMSFVAGIVHDVEDAALIKAIVSMGKALGLTVVAEGVELEEQLALLRGWDCDEIQGYLVSRPVPVAETDRFLRGVKLL